METILFIMLPFPSHFISVYGLANHYKSLGYDVIFTGTRDLKGLVEIENFKFVEFQYPLEDTINTFNSFIGTILKGLSDRFFSLSMFKLFIKQKNEFEKLYSYLSPSHIFIDEHLAECSIFYKNVNVTVSIVNTKLSTRKVVGVPPLCSSYQADGSKLSNVMSNLLWLRHHTSLTLKKYLHKVAFLGRDETFFWKKYCKKSGINWKDTISEENSFYKTVKGLTTYVLAPTELEYYHKIYFPNEKYVHFAFQRNEDRYFDETYRNLIKWVELKKFKNYKIVGCSFGTINKGLQKEVLAFYDRLNKISLSLPNVIFVVSDSHSLSGIFEKNTNIKFVNYLPILHFLKRCDGFILHGGLTTIKECFDAQVPMLVYPINPNYDNSGNAARIAINGYGIMGNFRKDGQKKMLKHVEKLLSMNVKWPQKSE